MHVYMNFRNATMFGMIDTHKCSLARAGGRGSRTGNTEVQFGHQGNVAAKPAL